VIRDTYVNFRAHGEPCDTYVNFRAHGDQAHGLSPCPGSRSTVTVAVTVAATVTVTVVCRRERAHGLWPMVCVILHSSYYEKTWNPREEKNEVKNSSDRKVRLLMQENNVEQCIGEKNKGRENEAYDKVVDRNLALLIHAAKTNIL
jgi:hypothetical protein